DPSTPLGELSTLLRDVLMKKVAPSGGKELLSGGYGDDILSGLCSSFTPGALMNNIDIIQSALTSMKSGQAKTICELCLISLSEPDLGDDLPQLRERVAKLERAFKNGIPTAVQSAPPAVSEHKPAEIPFDTPEEDELPPFDMEPPHEEDRPPFDMEPPPYYDEVDYFPAPPVFEERPPIAAYEEPTPTFAAPVGTASDNWDQVKNALETVLPVGIYSIIKDSSQISAKFNDDTLTLNMSPGFAMNMVNRPDTLATIANVASEVCGKRYVVKVAERSADTAPGTNAGGASALDNLSKFDIVKFN
ncbi:MAG: hypothetical protein IKV47_07420, partial [Oscillospiraceae bacterium]|nr:hypothetical protein [Oscillospiraceae bacterium]